MVLTVNTTITGSCQSGKVEYFNVGNACTLCSWPVS